MEKDDEVKGAGNGYTSEYRAYDPRLGRWFSLDPAMRSNMSMYVGFSNNPVIKIDPRGNDDFFDKAGNLIYSTSVGNNIRVINTSIEAFKNAVITGTPIITAELKSKDSRSSAMNHFLESYSAPLGSFDFGKGGNNAMLVNIGRHYYNRAQIKDLKEHTIDGSGVIGGILPKNAAVADYGDTWERPAWMNIDPEHFSAVFIGGNYDNRINPGNNNYYNLMSTLIHETQHYLGLAAGDNDPASHLNAYWAEVTSNIWSLTTTDFQDATIKNIGLNLLNITDINKRNTLQQKFEDQLGIKFKFEQKAPETEGGLSSTIVTYEKK